MSGTTVIIYLACIIILIMIGKVFYVPLKHIFKLILNTILGGLLIYIVNIIGSSYNFHVGLNYATAIFTGVLGVPGVVVLIITKLLLQ
jgi:inhibitor of the pro-sigma K processing machinery